MTFNDLCEQNKIIDIDEFLHTRKAKPDYVYHYTSTYGFLSIFEHNNIRLTNCNCLNDKKEYVYLIELILNYDFKNYVFGNVIKEIGKTMDEKRNCYINRTDNSQSSKYYILSCALEDDLLPMWIYYSKNGGYYGYSLKFRTNRLVKNLSQNNNGKLLYGTVIYNKEKQIRIIKQIVESVFKGYGINEEDIINKNYSEVNYIQASLEVIETLSYIRIFFKDTNFKNELEYRFAILNSSDKDNFSIDDKGFIRNFIEKSICDPFPISGITMSPSMEFLNNVISIQYFMKSKNMRPIIIKKSKLNMRF